MFWGRIKVYLDPWAGYSEFQNQSQRYREEYINRQLENPERAKWVWTVAVAGMGFFIDAYSFWSINIVYPMLEIVYYNGSMPSYYLLALNITTLAGIIIGQVVFGIAADRFGRRKMYGQELIITIVGTVGCAMASRGASDSMYLMGWLCSFRFILGLGIGADYPLSAVICSEMASTPLRDRMLTTVFACQPVGQLAACIIAVICVYAARDNITGIRLVDCTNHPSCVQSVDSIWRVIVGLGAVPAAFALYFRLTIIESPLYTLDVAKDTLKASADVFVYTGWKSTDVGGTSGTHIGLGVNGTELDRLPSSAIHTTTQMPNGNDPQRNDEIETVNLHQTETRGQEQGRNSTGTAATDHRRLSNAPRSPLPGRDGPIQQALQVLDNDLGFWGHYWKDFKKYYWHDGNLRTLIATAFCWGCLDLPFYGLGTSDTQILNKIWSNTPIDTPPAPPPDVFGALLQDACLSMLMVQMGSIIGVLITLLSVEKLGPRLIQLIGFGSLFVLFISLGGSYTAAMNSQKFSVVVFLYILCQVFYNFGPNTTTFMLPAQIFPTRFRCTSHGISAATGKLGSVVAQLAIGIPQSVIGQSTNGQSLSGQWLGWVLIGFAPFMLVGLALTFWIPNTHDEKGNPKNLRELAKGRGINGFSQTKVALRMRVLYHRLAKRWELPQS